MKIPLLQVNEIAVRGADGEELIQHINFSVEAAERVALVGPNGAGKTTCAKAVAGIRPYSSGAIQVNGVHEVNRLLPRELSRLVSYVPQRVENLPYFTVEDFLKLSGDGELNARAYSLVSHLGERCLPELSGGELQRVLIAGAIAQEAQLVVLDEPTASLDPRGRREVEELLCTSVAKDVSAETKASPAILLITHDISLAVRVCERVLIMKQGTIMWDGFPQDPQMIAQLEDAYGCSFKRLSSDGVPFVVSV
jgi:iron complex transport system ATP-binding protein